MTIDSMEKQVGPALERRWRWPPYGTMAAGLNFGNPEKINFYK
jgi:hypothetical protein